VGIKGGCGRERAGWFLECEDVTRTFPNEFLDGGWLMSPDEVEAKLGTNRLDE
jgi:hypothetical protein